MNSAQSKVDAPRKVSVCICQRCGKQFWIQACHAKRGQGKFCNRKCTAEARLNTGTGRFIVRGYVKINRDRKLRSEHRVIMEKRIGRKLRPDELVHHLNGNKSDNRISNLKIVSRKEHSLIHLGLNGKWAHGYDQCSECGTVDRPHCSGGLCRRCYIRSYARNWRRRQQLALERRA